MGVWHPGIGGFVMRVVWVFEMVVGGGGRSDTKPRPKAMCAESFVRYLEVVVVGLVDVLGGEGGVGEGRLHLLELLGEQLCTCNLILKVVVCIIKTGQKGTVERDETPTPTKLATHAKTQAENKAANARGACRGTP